MDWVFETLGISKDADASTIRKAYARAIKQCDQATEADRFQRIRQAYEWALQWEKHRPAQPLDTAQLQASSAQPVVVVHQQPVSSAPAPVPNNRPAPAIQTRQPVASNDPDRQIALAVLDELVREARGSHPPAKDALLSKYANDERLTPLDAKSAFEVAVLTYSLTNAPPDIPLLDAAHDLFSWELYNKHLLAARPDLVQRMQRHQALRRLLTANQRRDEADLNESIRNYHLIRQQPALKAEPWEVLKTNEVIKRYDTLKQELDERFDAVALDWWRQKFAQNPNLQASYEERQAREREFTQLKVQPRRRTSSGGLRWLWVVFPLLSLIGHLAGNSSAPVPYQTPTQGYEVPQPQTQTTRYSTGSTDPNQRSSQNLRQLADAGDVPSQFDLGKAYATGNGVPQDFRQAAIWYKAAADKGSADAQYELAKLYKQGLGIPQDPVAAHQMLLSAAQNGQIGARYDLADAYAKGDGVKQDYNQAYVWWHRAMQQGSTRATTALGWMYQTGHGVERNDIAAANWYRQAAAQGDPAAQTYLALMYEKGTGVHKNIVTADALLSLANMQENSPEATLTARSLQRISSMLNPDQARAASMLTSRLAAAPVNVFPYMLESPAPIER
jgi:TPR repeat protein